MLKRSIALLLCIIMCAPVTCFAQDTIAGEVQQVETAPEKKVYTLSIDDAIGIALKDNEQLAVCDYQKLNYKYSLEAARVNRRKTKGAPIYVSSGYEMGYVQDGYYLDLFETQMKLSDKNKEKTEATIIYNVMDAYWAYKFGEQSVSKMQTMYDMAVENKLNVDKLSELGMVSAIEVENAQLTVDEAYNTLNSMTSAMFTLKEMLKIALNIDEDCDFVLTSDIDIEPFTTDFEADLESAMITRYDVVSLNENLRLAERHFNVTKKLAPDTTAAYYSDLSTYMQTKYTTETSIKTIKVAIKSSYDDTVNTQADVKVKERNAQIKKTLYDAAKLKFEMGMITNIELTKALTDYSMALMDLDNAKLKCKLAITKYHYDITIGL